MVKSRRYFGLLNDYYGSLLTEHQSEIIRLYYDMDMSLKEIGDELGITRQGVKSVLIRTEKKLDAYEEKLQLYKKLTDVKNKLDDLTAEEMSFKAREMLKIISKEVMEI